MKGAGPSDPRPTHVRVALLIGGLAFTALLVAWTGWRYVGESVPLDVRSFVPLTILAVAGVLLRERRLGPHLGVTVGTVVLAAAIPLAGPMGAALIGAFSYLLDVHARTWRTRLFNSAMTGAVGAIGGMAYKLLGGQPVGAAPMDAWGLIAAIGLPLLGAYAVMTAANALFVGLMSTAVRRTRVLTVAGQALRSVGWGYLAHVVIAFLFVVLWGPVGLGSVASIFVVGPLLVAHWTIGRAGLAFHEHQETVTSFVAALEESEPSSVGHSTRVASLAESLGSVLGLGFQAAEELRYAALLHDIGLVGVRAELKEEQDAGEVSYLSAVISHPEAGVAALRGLDFLSGALPAIAHHHERWDGYGYPSGLAGQDIPRAARVIAVADAFDALTDPVDGPGLSPAEALAQLRARQGSHLDPEVVEAMSTVVGRWRGAETVEGGRQDRGSSSGEPGEHQRGLPNHDLPTVSDAFARWQPETMGRPS